MTLSSFLSTQSTNLEVALKIYIIKEINYIVGIQIKLVPRMIYLLVIVHIEKINFQNKNKMVESKVESF